MMPAIIPGPSRRLIVCPTTHDGLATSVILNRHLGSGCRTLFLSESVPAAILDYPVFRDHRRDTHLYLAGMAFDAEAAGGLAEDAPGRLTWLSHHFWPLGAEKALGGINAVLHVDPRFSSTSALALEKLGVRDEVSTACARFLAAEKPPADEFWRRWFFAFFAVRKDPYRIRHCLAALYDRDAASVGPPEEEEDVEEGQARYANIAGMLDSGNVHVFPLAGSASAAVAMLPASLLAEHRLLAELIFDRGPTSLVLLGADGSDQIIVRRNEAAGAPDVHSLGAYLDQVLGRAAAKLFDQATIVVETSGAPGAVLAQLVDGLRHKGPIAH